ncbi:hypothetical protein A464_1740 [Salmonella bongori N268-08]|uniref:Uncharacterized protein n=1 Tax=Salmonella bongori N268-08 TaxID=1197719 RepID=S5N8J4_SALBN|nr:hypothetical protein A464_1740 [Salmonella bongori N268-08]
MVYGRGILPLSGIRSVDFVSARTFIEHTPITLMVVAGAI